MEPESMFKKISFRLGMEGNLLTGICLGIIATGLIMVFLLVLASPDAVIGITVGAALVISAIVVAVIIFMSKKTRKSSVEDFCTCRYRQSIYTLCRECALKELKKGSETEDPG